MSNLPKTAAFLCSLFLLVVSSVKAQEVGVDICACSPSTYEFTFNFALACPRPGGDYGPGISEVTCFITSFSAEVDDLIPVEVQTISIIEADVNRVPIAQSAIEGEFFSGSTFTYSSVAALGNTTSDIPQSIQLTITGTNAENSSLVQVWAIKFTNDCGVYPVLEMGTSFGWTEFTELGAPRNEVCPIAPTPPATEPPSGSESLPASTPTPTMGTVETDAPTIAPTKNTTAPTFVEATVPPTIFPTFNPTETQKTLPPTEAPTLLPTLAPSPGPTLPETAPVPPTKPPKGKTTDAPTMSPTPPTILPTMATNSPTKQPITPPTMEELLTEQPSMEMSFSYVFAEDYDFEDEWGRPSKKKKDKKDDDKDGRDRRVRVGGHRRYY